MGPYIAGLLVIGGIMWAMFMYGYNVAVKHTEARWAAEVARLESYWQGRQREWHSDRRDLNTALAPYGEQLCKSLPRDGDETITLPFFAYIAIRASLSSVSRWVTGPAECLGYETMSWRAHRLIQGPRP